MRLALCVLLAVFALALLGGMAWSYPTRFGPVTGLVDMPTADIASSGSAELAADYATLEGDQKLWPVRVLAGVSDTTEIGFGYAKFQDGEKDKLTSIAGKVGFMEEPVSSFGFAMGVGFLDTPGDDVFDIYAVASKELTVGARRAYLREQTPQIRLRGHVGVMYSRFRQADVRETKPFVGFDVTSSEGVSFVGEYKWTKVGRDHAAVAIRYPLTPVITAEVGVARLGSVLPQEDLRFFLGFDYSFATAGDEAPAF